MNIVQYSVIVMPIENPIHQINKPGSHNVNSMYNKQINFQK